MISVVTITFNNFSELKETLQSIQGIDGIESVVINGGKCEESKNFLSSHKGVVVNEKDDGISDAFNKGVKNSTGDAIAFLNSGDTLLDREYYLWASRVLKEDPTIGFVYSDLLFVDSIAGETVMKPRASSGLNLGTGMPFPHPTMIVRREVFEKAGLFSKDYKIAMDFDWVVRVVAAGVTGKYYPHATVKMDGAGVSSTRELQGILECKRSLLAHGQFTPAAQWGYRKRLIAYNLRNSLGRVFGSAALKAAKKLKNALS